MKKFYCLIVLFFWGLSGFAINNTDKILDTNNANPGLILLKEGVYVDYFLPTGASPGDRIDYTFTITNNTSEILTNVYITDANAIVTGNPITLNPGETNTTNFTGVHTIAQSDIDVGQVNNIATVYATPPTGPVISSLSIDPTPCTTCNTVPTCPTCTSTPLVQSPSIMITMDNVLVDSNLNGFSDIGDIIVYNFVVTNTGNVTLTNITITNPNATILGGPIATLAVGASDSTTFSSTYAITQADIEAGQVESMAMVSGIPPSGPSISDFSNDPTPCAACAPLSPNCITCTITMLILAPSISITMDGVFVDNNNNGISEIGDAVLYNFVVTNTGNVSLFNIQVTVPNAIVTSGPLTSLPVGASDSTTLTAIYFITEADIVSGQVDALATVIASTAIGGAPVFNNSIDPTPCTPCTPLTNCTLCTIVPLLPEQLILNVFSSYLDYNNDGYTSIGDVINYQYTVSNSSPNFALTNITVTSSNVSVLGGPIASLAPSSSDNTTFTGVYVVTQSDINNGLINTSTTANAFLSSNPINSVTIVNTLNLNLSNGIKLNAFIDYDANGVQNNGEPNFNLGEFHYELNNNGTLHNINTSNGMFLLYESNPINSYTFSYSINPSYQLLYSVSPSSYSNITVANGSGITTYNFPITQLPYSDLAVYLVPINSPAPGFNYVNKIIYKNQGNQTIASGTITFNSNNVLIINSYPVGAVPNASGFTYNFSNLAPNETRAIYVYFTVPTIPTVSIGQLLTNSVTISIPPNDINTTNNSAVLTQAIIGAYDPNDKQESHGGRILHSAFTSNDYLTYTIRFENIGTANAINVRVNDVLDSQLNPNSIRMVDASHAYVLDRVGTTLNWRFDGIELPPSVPNTTIGHGYITFQIKPNAGYAIGDVIPNFANIYFDFNPAIVTNTANTEFVAALSNTNFAFTNLNYFPNPVKNTLTLSNTAIITEVAITTVLGQKVMYTKVNDFQTEIDVSPLSNGIYLVKISSDGQEKTVKIIKEKLL